MANPYYIPPRDYAPGDNLVRNMMNLSELKMRRDHGQAQIQQQQEQLQLDREKMAFTQAVDPLARRFNGPDNLTMKKLFDSIGLPKSSFLEEADNWVNNPNMTHGNIFSSMMRRRGDFLKEMTQSALENGKKPGYAGSEMEELQNGLLEAASTDEGWEGILGKAFPQVADAHKAQREQATLAAQAEQQKLWKWQQEQALRERNAEINEYKAGQYGKSQEAYRHNLNTRTANIGRGGSGGNGKEKEWKPPYNRKDLDKVEADIKNWFAESLDGNKKPTGKYIYRPKEQMEVPIEAFNSSSDKPYYYHYGTDEQSKPKLYKYSLPVVDGRQVTPLLIQKTADMYGLPWEQVRDALVRKGAQQKKKK